MTIAVLGATGRLGRMLRHFWGPDEARYLGRSVTPHDLEGCTAVVDLRGVVTGKGDVTWNSAIAQDALDAAYQAGAGRVLLPSTAAVYGNRAGPLSETMAAPISDYGQAKLEMEQMAADHPQPCTSLRYGNIAGADTLLAAWQPGCRIDQFPDGQTPRRTYIGPGMLSRVIRALCATQTLPDTLPDVLNVASPGVIGMGALLDAAGLAWQPRPASQAAIACVELDLTRLRSCIPGLPEVTSTADIIADWQAWRRAA